MSFIEKFAAQILVLFFLSLLTPAVLADASRFALIIGNSQYKHVPYLRNPTNDARGIAQALTNLGFDVQVKTDLDRLGLESAIDDFGRRAANVDVALFFYAGHGIQANGSNYLIPTDAELDEERDLRRMILLEDVLAEAGETKQLGIVILDACRDNPFATTLFQNSGKNRSIAVGRGLARVENMPADVLIAYATDANATANDGDSQNSPFTTALLKHLPTPGREIRLLFGDVRDDVMKATNNTQRPFIYGSLGGEGFYFAPTISEKKLDIPQIQDDNLFKEQFSNLIQHQSMLEVWRWVEREDTCAAYQLYLDEFPDSTFARLAKLKLRNCKTTVPPNLEAERENAAWVWAEEEKSCKAYEIYLNNYPSGLHSASARNKLYACEQKEIAKAEQLNEQLKLQAQLQNMEAERKRLSEQLEKERNQAENQRQIEQQQRLEQQRQLEQQRLEQQRQQEQQRLEQQRQMEQQRLEQQRLEQQRQQEQQRQNSIRNLEQQALELVRAYYADLDRADAQAAISKWIDPPSSLSSLITNIEWFQINELRIEKINDIEAYIFADVQGKNNGLKPERWQLTIILTRQDQSWRIIKMTNFSRL